MDVGVRVAAVESLIGLNLEMGQDGAALLLADSISELSKQSFNLLEALRIRVEPMLLELESALKKFRSKNLNMHPPTNLPTELAGTSSICFPELFTGNVLLSLGEFLHATGNFTSAKECYLKAIEAMSKPDCYVDLFGLAACNMVPVEVCLGTTCALGQLEAHSGNFSDAEEILTRALTKAE
ncbi:hypothetical protein IFM89_000626 [Coptis chinensis]|uniref:Uncharacterized protein n=1 Tax=Coptis chinensis TaxID=261450 RepID=A0A835LHA6_9MAGN|nr:hypothetical protein IFM89_000626 [Coptis chinensis]